MRLMRFISLSLFPAMVIYGSGTDYSAQFNNDANFTVETDAFSLSRDDESLVVVFPSGEGDDYLSLPRLHSPGLLVLSN